MSILSYGKQLEGCCEKMLVVFVRKCSTNILLKVWILQFIGSWRSLFGVWIPDSLLVDGKLNLYNLDSTGSIITKHIF